MKHVYRRASFVTCQYDLIHHNGRENRCLSNQSICGVFHKKEQRKLGKFDKQTSRIEKRLIDDPELEHFQLLVPLFLLFLSTLGDEPSSSHRSATPRELDDTWLQSLFVLINRKNRLQIASRADAAKTGRRIHNGPGFEKAIAICNWISSSTARKTNEEFRQRRSQKQRIEIQ